MATSLGKTYFFKQLQNGWVYTKSSIGPDINMMILQILSDISTLYHA